MRRSPVGNCCSAITAVTKSRQAETVLDVLRGKAESAMADGRMRLFLTGSGGQQLSSNARRSLRSGSGGGQSWPWKNPIRKCAPLSNWAARTPR